MSAVRTLVVEDEATAAEAHASYVERVPGFELAGVARSAAEAARLLTGDAAVDLVLLDMHLPDRHGMEVCRGFRASGRAVEFDDLVGPFVRRQIGDRRRRSRIYKILILDYLDDSIIICQR